MKPGPSWKYLGLLLVALLSLAAAGAVAAAGPPDVIGEYARADRALVERAIEAATAAFPKWSMSGVQERSDILDRIGTEILARKAQAQPGTRSAGLNTTQLP